MIREKRIVVTGGGGFLGSHVVDLLADNNEIFVPRSAQYDLRNPEAAKQIFSDFGKTDLVIHAASMAGGLKYNQTHPGSELHNNSLINLNVVDASCAANVKKLVGIGSICEYPANTEVPFDEKNLWNGRPSEGDGAFGVAKRLLLAQCDAYRRQYGFCSVHLLPANLYGPRDYFDPERAHVILSLLTRMTHAKENGIDSIEIFGTGKDVRGFIYIEDAAEAVIRAADFYEGIEPLNISSRMPTTIAEIAETIKAKIGYRGGVVLHLNRSMHHFTTLSFYRICGTSAWCVRNNYTRRRYRKNRRVVSGESFEDRVRLSWAA